MQKCLQHDVNTCISHNLYFSSLATTVVSSLATTVVSSLSVLFTIVSWQYKIESWSCSLALHPVFSALEKYTQDGVEHSECAKWCH